MASRSGGWCYKQAQDRRTAESEESQLVKGATVTSETLSDRRL
jgi:hypothetical protein